MLPAFPLSRLVDQTRTDTRGGTGVVAGLLMALLAAFAGAGIDMARMVDARSRTALALDTAVLAGARALQLNPQDEESALAVATRVYQDNVAKRMPVENDSVTFVVLPDKRGISAEGTASLKTTLLNVIGITSMRIAGDPVAKFPVARIKTGGLGNDSNVEIALMLDVTGSMCNDGEGPCVSGTKIDALKTAATELISIAVQDDQSKYTSRVALVPFSTRVRVGPDSGGGTMMKLLTGLDPTFTGYTRDCIQETGTGSSETIGSWQCLQYAVQFHANVPILPCVTERGYSTGAGMDHSDEAPGPGMWLNGHGGDREPISQDSADLPLKAELGLTSADPSQNWNYDFNGCEDTGKTNTVVPLTSDKAALSAAVNGLEAYGSTAGALGTAFAWYMLSPKWKDIWTGASEPGSYTDVTTKQASGAPVLRKVAVLMTDGQFNTYRADKNKDAKTMAEEAKKVCANMKAAGIEIYTVAFALDQLPSADRDAALDTMRTCGSDLKHFYETLTPTQLVDAFRDIALQTSSVVLTY